MKKKACNHPAPVHNGGQQSGKFKPLPAGKGNMEKNLCNGVENISFQDLQLYFTCLLAYRNSFSSNSLEYLSIGERLEKLGKIIAANQ